ncbi:XTP/dITP diphosphohydrolase [Granulicella aggregans]|uniref:dITP/XTP pyrophosphatase n=1 Tax=Granulicella aggregans TaxID=474949 RepID=A0A7W7ZA12_9BACT|nr:non-canonical purine NTP pyrophosphatase [Granulicella aggregans]MBB5056040.1 XTP/dITP diphosphohydrolase [Granulicella aggregans]
MTRRLLVASTNKGKLRDFAIAAGADVNLVPLPGLEGIAAPDEDEDTFVGNARIKATYYSRFAPGEIVIADDSGLEVDALDGAPGVRSARYADDIKFVGEGSADVRNNACLMAALVGVEARAGRYRCALVAARDGVVLAVGDGTVEGRILVAAQGYGGFGYDPYFLPEGATGSMAEIDSTERLLLSHRGRALRDLLPKLML